MAIIHKVVCLYHPHDIPFRVTEVKLACLAVLVVFDILNFIDIVGRELLDLVPLLIFGLC